MKAKGVNYDTGTYLVGHLSRDVSPEKMEDDINMIKDDLNANSIRVYGMEKDKLHQASKMALDRGMEVWYSPRHINVSPAQTLRQIAQYAKDAESLRKENPNVVFVLGNEFTLDVNGFYDGKYWTDRARGLGHADHRQANTKLRPFVKKALDVARKNFGGKITYASGFWEDVDWSDFDFVSVNKYMFGWNKDSYERELRDLKKYGKPIAITEFGGGSFKGAYDRNEPSHTIIDWQKREVKEGFERDEGEQAKHMKKLLKMYEKEGVYGAFPYTFVEDSHPHSEDPRKDFDMGSYNLVKVLEDGTYVPKESFKEVSKFYKTHEDGGETRLKGLESLVVFLGIAFLGGGAFFMSPNFTGRAIDPLGNSTTNGIGTVLLVLAFILGVFIFKKRK